MDYDVEDNDESSATFGEMIRENIEAHFPVYDHCNNTGHTTAIDNFGVVGRKDQNLTRTIKESMCMR